jgi:hypothetical protein
MMMPSPQQIPMTAWEQAVIVCLFIVGFLGIMGYLLRWTAKRESGWQSFIKQQTDSWHKVVSEQNQKWQDWMGEQRVAEERSMTKICESVEALGKKLDAHDSKVEARIERIRKKSQHDSAEVVESD